MKNKWKKLLATVLAGGLLAACGAGGGEAKPAADKGNDAAEKADGEISVMLPEWGLPSDDMLDEFEKDSGVKVNLMPTDWDDIRDKISTAAVGKKAAADVYEVDWSWVGEFKSAGWLEPLDLDEDTVKDIPSLDTFKVEDKYYAVPYSNEYRMGFYNKKQFDEAGVSEAPETWEGMIQAGQSLKDKGVSDYPVAMPMAADENTTTFFLATTYAMTGQVFNDDNTLNKENALKTLQVMDQINQDGLVDPAYRTTNEGKFDLLTKGEAAMAVAPSFYAIRTDGKDSAVNGEVNVMNLPGEAGPSDKTVAFVEAVGISPYSENPAGARAFVDWYTSEATQKQLFDVVEILPTRNSALHNVVENGDIREAEPMLQLAEQVGSPFPNGVPNYYTEMSTAMFNTISEMANGKLSPEEAAEQMAQKVDELAKNAD